MSTLITETTSFTVGAAATPVLRRNFIRAVVPAAPTIGTTVVMFVAPDEPAFKVASDHKPMVVR